MEAIKALAGSANEILLWVSGITGLSTGAILLMALAFGKQIADGIVTIAKVLFAIAAIVFLIGYMQSNGLVDITSLAH